MKAEPKKVPTACIAREKGASYCGRELASGEFAFNDADYAVRNYAAGTTIRACPKCVTVCKENASKNNASNGPLATRGLENTR